ncbi:hypothetical protein COCNU_contig69155305G000010 [Cocos nucifera]|nr:hypothetical protein [Cocos nucifera]
MHRACGRHPLPKASRTPNPFLLFRLPPSKRESLPQTHRSAKGIRKGFRSPQPPAMVAGICCAKSAARSLACRIAMSLLPCRSFGAAAVAVAVEELEYGSEWEEEYGRGRWAAAEVAKDEWGEMEGRGVQWVFMGSPGAQKHVYATRIAKLLEVPYISMGTLVRQELNPRSTLYKKVLSSLSPIVPFVSCLSLSSRRKEILAILFLVFLFFLFYFCFSETLKSTNVFFLDFVIFNGI